MKNEYPAEKPASAKQLPQVSCIVILLPGGKEILPAGACIHMNTSGQRAPIPGIR
jgi:hypothetical protein